MTDDTTSPIRRAAVEAAALEVLTDLGDRRGIGAALYECDDDIQNEIGTTVAIAAIAAYLDFMGRTTEAQQIRRMADER
jgi:hypothetical protein